MYEDKTPQAIKADILGNLVEAGSDLSVQEGDFADTNAGPLAIELHKVYSSFNALRYLFWVDETSGKYLDLAAEALGIVPRKEGSKAKVTLLVTGTPLLVIAKGTVFIAKENLYFATNKDEIIPEQGELAVDAEAQKVGVAYNVPANTIVTQFSNLSGITTVTNLNPALGGADKETDGSLYARIDSARKKPYTSGNKYDYERWALEVSGVGIAIVLPLWNGNGTVKVIVGGVQKEPVDNGVLENCKAHIEEMRPIGATVTVESVTMMNVDISATLVLEDGRERILLIEEIKKQLRNHFAKYEFKYDRVVYNWVGAVLIGIGGVEDYQNLDLNNGQIDLLLEPGQTPILGEVVLA